MSNRMFRDNGQNIWDTFRRTWKLKCVMSLPIFRIFRFIWNVLRHEKNVFMNTTNE